MDPGRIAKHRAIPVPPSHCRDVPRALGRLFFLGTLLCLRLARAEEAMGLFEGHAEVGRPSKAGGLRWEASSGTYTVSGGGANMWSTNDAFHFVWKRIQGDVSLAADVTILGEGGDPHRKACLMIRQTLDADSAYADAALHGDGLTSLQYRPSRGERTYEIQSRQTKPVRLRIERRGNYVSMSLADAQGMLQPAGGTFRLDLDGGFYVGLGVCAHNDARLEQATFARVELSSGPAPAQPAPRLFSTLETVTISSRDRRVVWCATNHFEAPNWSRDGASLIINSRGGLFRLPVAGGEPVRLDTGFATRCNNDHGLSPDGTQLVISDQSQEDRKSRIYLLPATGGTPRLITPEGPSYWHGWSPDGATLAYCAQRNGEYDIYSIPAAGGSETRLTRATGLDDGPDYSPDGQWIYFNSDRTGLMQIWRMRADGSNPEQVTHDEANHWFPHPSPDGQWLVFLTYAKDVKGHPENQDVTLHLLPLRGGPVQVLAKLYGGQGTINVPSWSPDSRRLAFVSYQWAP